MIFSSLLPTISTQNQPNIKKNLLESEDFKRFFGKDNGFDATKAMDKDDPFFDKSLGDATLAILTEAEH